MSLELRIFAHRPGMIAKGSAEDLFVNSYLGMRFAIGTVAFTLPFLLIIIDWLFIEDRVIRGSMSAYYHSGAREIFVGGLFVVGGFLLTYMSARRNTYDFILSLFAGVAVILVAIFPTARYEVLVDGEPTTFKATRDSCEGRFSGPPICSPLQEAIGESGTRVIHTISAGAFVLLLAALCVLFALREFGYGNGAEYLCGDHRNPRLLGRELRRRKLVWRHLTAGTDLPQGAFIPEPHVLHDKERINPPSPRHARKTLYFLTLSLLILFGAVIAVTVSTYWGEVIAFVSFGIAWLYAGKDLRSVKQAKDRLLRSR